MTRYRRSEAAILDSFGLRQAEEHLAAGTELRRAMLFDAWNRPRVAVEYVRSAGSEPTIRIYAPRNERDPSVAQSLSAAVPGREWQRLMALGANFDRELASAVRPRPRRGDDEAIVVCADASTIVVEAVGAPPPARAPSIRRNIDNTCNRRLGYELADQLAEAAVPLLPPCGELSRERFDNGWGILEACLMLRGDRMAAALALNQASWLSNSRPDHLSALGLMANDVAIDWQGEQISGRDAGRIWGERMSAEPSSYIFITSATGETGDRVTIRGILSQWRHADPDEPQLFHAPVTQIWVSDYDTFRLRHMIVGAYALVPKPVRQAC